MELPIKQKMCNDSNKNAVYNETVLIMVRKCCMVSCNTHYDPKKGEDRDGGRKIAVFRFPSEKSEPEDRKKWIEVCSKIRADLKVTNETVICELHWPENYPTYRKKGRDRPAVPPSLFPGIPSSIIPEPPPPPRETERTSNQLRNTLPDEFDDFERMDQLTYTQLEEQFILSDTRKLAIPTTAFSNSGFIYIQSITYFQGIPTFIPAGMVRIATLNTRCIYVAMCTYQLNRKSTLIQR